MFSGNGAWQAVNRWMLERSKASHEKTTLYHRTIGVWPLLLTFSEPTWDTMDTRVGIAPNTIII